MAQVIEYELIGGPLDGAQGKTYQGMQRLVFAKWIGLHVKYWHYELYRHSSDLETGQEKYFYRAALRNYKKNL